MDTRLRITEHAAPLFFKHGIRSITMDEIAESMGMSKRTLYESFANKEALLNDCIEWKYQESLDIQEEIVAEHEEDPLEIIHQHFRHALIMLNSIHPSFIRDLQKYHIRLWKQHASNKQQENIDFTRKVLEKGVEKGIFRKDADLDVLSRMVHTFLPMLSSTALFPETKYARTEVVRQVLLNFIRGLATPAGLTLIDEKFSG